MVKHPINKSYANWNLTETGCLLREHFEKSNLNVNVLIIKADKMHLKTFAKLAYESSEASKKPD